MDCNFTLEFLKAKPIDLSGVIALRQKVLHPTGPIDRVIYSEDSDESTLHLILKEGGVLVACGTLIDEGDGVFRIRGMAVSESLRGQGVGSKLVELFIAHAVKNQARLIWCNGRVAALSLYERKGFVKTGEVFDVPGSGPHYKLMLNL